METEVERRVVTNSKVCAILVLISAFGCSWRAEAGGAEVEENSGDTKRVRALVSGDEAVRTGAVASYCTRELGKTDPAYYPCILNRFRSSGDASEFLAQIPSDPSGLAALWKVDETLMKGIASPRDIPKPLGAATFLAAFLRALAKTAETQPLESIERLLVLQDHADGWMAEMIEQSNLDLFVLHPSLLVDNWSVVEKHKSVIGFGTTDFESRREAIERVFADYCSTNGRPEGDCARVVRFLAQS